MSNLDLLWANLHRHPVRTYLTLLSVLVAFLLFGLLRTLAVWFGSAPAEGAAADRLVVSAKYSIIESLPISQMNVILGIDGVEAVTHQDWFGGNYQDGRSFFPKFPVNPRAYFEMFPELIIDPAELDAFERTRTGAVVAEGMLAQYGWQIGDKIPIEADIWPMANGNRNWVFDLVGTYTAEEGGQPGGAFLFQYDYFDEARGFGRGTVGWYTVRIADPDAAPVVANAIDSRFENSMNPTKTATEDEFGKAFASQIGDLGLMATGILSAVFFTVLLLTANTMTQALRERIPELAVLKTLGFGNPRVAWLVLGESVVLCVAGGSLGIGLAALFAPAANAIVPFGSGDLALGWQTAATGVGVAVLLGLVVGVAPAVSAGRLSIAEALRRS